MKKKGLLIGMALGVIGLTAVGCGEVEEKGEAGQVKEVSPEVVDSANGSDEKKAEDPKEETGDKDSEEIDEIENVKETKTETEAEIPPQGFTQCMMYDIDGGEVLITQAEDGYWYDENGLCYGYWTEILEAGEAGVPVSDENGKLYYWTAEGHTGEEIPLQGAFSAILYDKNGNSVRIHLNDNAWYDEENVCYGTSEEVDDAGITGSPVTNENGETYYWTCPN